MFVHDTAGLPHDSILDEIVTRLGIAGVSQVSTDELQSNPQTGVKFHGRAQPVDPEGEDERLDLRPVDRKLTLWMIEMAPRCRYNHGATRKLPEEDWDHGHRSC